mmetsp:Transcript_124243/g.345844  ORF Transcript_124243/g.345844 Transcript_124243/m.345844 type:complete len:252 (-) Transcript_124243:379-1134(-)
MLEAPRKSGSKRRTSRRHFGRRCMRAVPQGRWRNPKLLVPRKRTQRGSGRRRRRIRRRAWSGSEKRKMQVASRPSWRSRSRRGNSKRQMGRRRTYGIRWPPQRGRRWCRRLGRLLLPRQPWSRCRRRPTSCTGCSRCSTCGMPLASSRRSSPSCPASAAPNAQRVFSFSGRQRCHWMRASLDARCNLRSAQGAQGNHRRLMSPCARAMRRRRAAAAAATALLACLWAALQAARSGHWRGAAGRAALVAPPR